MCKSLFVGCILCECLFVSNSYRNEDLIFFLFFVPLAHGIVGSMPPRVGLWRLCWSPEIKIFVMRYFGFGL